MNARPEPLLALLRGSRQRLLVRAVLLVLAAGLAAGALVWLGLGALEGARRMQWLALSAPVPMLPWALAATAAGAASAALLLGRRYAALRPGPLALAIDRRAGMDLSYATAMEAAAGPAKGPVARSLVADARARAEHLDPDRLWPLNIPPLRHLLLAGLLAAGAAFALSLAMPPLPDRAAPMETADDIRAEAQDLADRLNREAVLRQDPMLAAIARAIEERIAEAAPEISAEDLDKELDALADQARTAFGDNTPSWLSERSKAGDMAGGENVSAGSGPRNPDSQQGDDIFAINLEDIESARRNQQRAILEADGRSPGEEAEAMGDIVAGDNKPAGSSMTPEKIEPQQMQSAGRESVGAAAESGKGPADQAGGGSNALEGDSMTQGAGGDDPMALPEAAQETGRRIRITLPPSEAEQAAWGDNGAAGGAGPGGATTQTVERQAQKAGSRAALARYFERLAE